MSFYIGWSEISITPEKKISLCGQFAERISEYVEKPVTATALALDNGTDQAVLCSCDLEGVSWRLVRDVRSNLAGNDLGLDPEKVVFNATHTHTSALYPGGVRHAAATQGFEAIKDTLNKYLRPGQKYVEKVDGAADPEVATTEEMYDFLVERLTQAAMEAWKNRQEGSFSSAFGRAAVGMCRRAVYNDASAQMWGDTYTAVFSHLEGGNDSGMELLYCFDGDNKLTGVVVNLACPAQCVQHRHFVSPDFWGEVKLLLRKHFGEHIFVLAQCSAAGDQCPVDLIRWVEPESELNDPNCTRTNTPKRKADPSMFDLAGMRKVGRRIANEIIEVWNDGLDPACTQPVFEHRVKTMQLPIRRATLTDVRNAEEGVKNYIQNVPGDIDYNDVAKLQIHLGVLNRFRDQETLNVMDTEVHLIRLGPVAFATSPFELFLDYGNQIKARSLAEQTFVIQLANGTEGYLPTEKAEKGGHYSAFLSSGQVGHAGGDQLVRESLQNIAQMFSE